MEYISTSEAAKKWGISSRRVAILCAENRIMGVAKIGKTWLIPKDANKPEDARILKKNKGMLFLKNHNDSKDDK
jgi:hypothetical protein